MTLTCFLKEKSRSRIFANKWTKIFLLLGLIQVLLSLVFLISIEVNAFQYTIASDTLEYETSKNDGHPYFQGFSVDPNYKILHVKLQVIWFILFELWRCWLVVASLIHCSSLTVITTGISTLFSLGFVGMIYVETSKMLRSDVYIKGPLQINLYLSIAYMVCLFVILIPTLFLVYRLFLDYGWRSYKKVGAHINVQAMYYMVNCFSLALKIDTFFEFLLMILYTVAISLHKVDDIIPKVISSIMAVLVLISLVLARKAISDESYKLMYIFIIIQSLFIAFNGFILIKSVVVSDPWFFVLFYGFTSILVAILTIVLSIRCLLNFGKGLKQHVRWSLFGSLNTDLTTEVRTVMLDEDEEDYDNYKTDPELKRAILNEHRLSSGENAR
ncbi:hypothetical protein BJ944DRAFT_272469 [Cunninghamella echinulata]|nr:hypothetical protein BJ944DRAFT_272469 [Cunninghamella echinulata]